MFFFLYKHTYIHIVYKHTYFHYDTFVADAYNSMTYLECVLCFYE